jgi:hypothetical protein
MLNVACSTAENINLPSIRTPFRSFASYQLETSPTLPCLESRSICRRSRASSRPGVWRIDKIAPNDVHHLPTVDLKLNSTFLSGLTASRRGEIRVEVSGQLLAEKKIEVNLLPPSQVVGDGHGEPEKRD